MNKKNIFQYDNYKLYLREYFKQESVGHGFKTRFAQAVQCQNSFVSQVLTGKAELSPEQTFRASKFLNHSQEESDFFQLLVQLHRATDKLFKAHLQSKIETIREDRNQIKNRVLTTLEIPIQAQAQYYSSWMYIAVHMAASLTPSKTPAEIARYLSLPARQVLETIEFLTSIDLVKLENGVVRMGPAHLHLPNDSVLIRTHHLNWRSKAQQTLDLKSPKNLHYSVVYSISKADAALLRNKILDLIQENLKVVAPSKEEILIANTIDFFEIGSVSDES
jgi:uncharacterized protein (TIGR02147 family)